MEYYSAKQVARELTIEAELLRKLSLIIEKTEMNPAYFLRDTKKKRLYTLENITEFERLIEKKRALKTSYTALIYASYGQNKVNKRPIHDTHEPQSEFVSYMDKHQEILNSQQEKMDYLIQLVEHVSALNAENAKKLTELTGKIDWITETSIDETKWNKSTEYELGLTSSKSKSGNGLIKRDEFRVLRNKVKKLYFRWEEYGKYRYLDKQGYSQYREYVYDSRAFFSQLVHLKRIGKYYVINKAVKEKLIAYGAFYDELEGTTGTLLNQ